MIIITIILIGSVLISILTLIRQAKIVYTITEMESTLKKMAELFVVHDNNIRGVYDFVNGDLLKMFDKKNK